MLFSCPVTTAFLFQSTFRSFPLTVPKPLKKCLRSAVYIFQRFSAFRRVTLRSTPFDCAMLTHNATSVLRYSLHPSSFCSITFHKNPIGYRRWFLSLAGILATIFFLGSWWRNCGAQERSDVNSISHREWNLHGTRKATSTRSHYTQCDLLLCSSHTPLKRARLPVSPIFRLVLRSNVNSISHCE